MDTVANLDRKTDDATAAGIGQVGLTVRDLAKVEKFYREAIGLGVVARGERSVVLGRTARGFSSWSTIPSRCRTTRARPGCFTMRS